MTIISATITLADSSLCVGKTTPVTFRFSEAVSGFTRDDVDLSDANGTLGALTARADGKTWSATFTPTDGVEDSSNTIRVNMGGVTDAAGNTGQGQARSENFSVDTGGGPLWRRGVLADNKLSAGESTTLTIVFSEALNRDSFTLGDLRTHPAGRGTLSNLRSSDGITWQVTLTAPTTGDASASNAVVFHNSDVTDVAGNAGFGFDMFSDYYSIDTQRPVLASATVSAFQLVLRYTEDDALSAAPAHVPANAAFAVRANGAANAVTSIAVDAEARTVTLTLERAVTADQAVTVRYTAPSTGNNAIQDAAGNHAASTQALSVTNNSSGGPRVLAALADSRLIAGETTTVTFNFSQAVTGFTSDDLDLDDAAGQLGPLTAHAGGRTWTATFTPTAGTDAANNTIRVNLGGVRNAAGSAGQGWADSEHFSIDTKRPALAESWYRDAQLSAGESATLVLRFSEMLDHDSFTLEDLQIDPGRGTLSRLRTYDDITWFVTLTAPTSGESSTDNRVRLRESGVTDVAGNAGGRDLAPTSSSYSIDTERPVLGSATVNASRLVLGYTEATTLSATENHRPENSAFAVLVNGTANAVSSVAVDAQAKTVTLTLARGVTANQTVSVSYTQPTIGNGVQDAAGNDAASFAAMAVDNRTPPALTGILGKAVVLRRTAMTVKEQSLETPGPDGAATAASDGIEDGTSVTLVAGSQDGKIAAGSDARVTRLEQEDAPAQLPKGMEMPLGLVRFDATLAAGRSSEPFSLYVDPALDANGYWVRDNAGTWVNLASEPYGGKMAIEGGRLRLDFSIQDGGPFDADGRADGSVTASGAAARMPLSIAGQTQDVEHGGIWI
ncbi:hypothetical protein D5041_06250 [Verminephrobacter aporrectodeae subsp. tuberculatae]|uniref:Ig-like domain-containing protein n=1 Tax=Verminephrobacter aporrectodeae TaxID=1110389 RepID=UPI002237488B|nr:Ig-like domain-containing protein [Verminephrobacter aporrectodeae]MCW5223207.1 hypothetical protein [Verminephrobacter aporrectodeae subsp. tuberculatae]MCW5288671.1 hypothetical protein [Verminephrobacter aporrectodeae subsp. tuberculatae]